MRPGRMGVGQRLERSAVGQGVISLLMLVLVVCVVAWNLPPGPLHDRVDKVAGPVVRASGLEQDWALFAPEPRSYSVGVYAEITRGDGQVIRWVPPHGGLLVAPYRTYRWQKYVERLRADDYSGLWEPTARWLARIYGSAQAPVTRVVLVRTFRDGAVVGSGAARPPAKQFAFYTLDLS